MGEDGAIGFDEGGVAGHAKVGLHVGGGVAGGVEEGEAEVDGGRGGEVGGAVPVHGVAVREMVVRAERGGGDGGGMGCGIFGVERCGGEVGGDGDGGGEGFGEAVGMDDITEEAVGAGGHGGEGEAEVAGGGEDGVEVEGGVHGGPADGVEVHEVTVVGEEVVVGAPAPFVLGGGDVGGDVEVEGGAGEGSGGGKRAEDVPSVGGGFNVPPLVAEGGEEEEEGEGDGRGEEASAAAGGVWGEAGGEAGFADGGSDEGGEREYEEGAEEGEGEAEAALHAEGGDRHGGDGDGCGVDAEGVGDGEVDLPGAGAHDPEGAGVEVWIGRGSLHGVGGRWVEGGLAGEEGRGDGDEGDVMAEGGRSANFDVGNAGEDDGHADSNEEGVGAGLDLLEDIFRADMGEGCGGSEQKQDEGDKAAERVHVIAQQCASSCRSGARLP